MFIGDDLGWKERAERAEARVAELEARLERAAIDGIAVEHSAHVREVEALRARLAASEAMAEKRVKELEADLLNAEALVAVAKSEFAKHKPRLVWNRPVDVPTIKEQAEVRGEAQPFGKTIAELRALGYKVYADLAEFAVMTEYQESPTGAWFRVPFGPIWKMVCEDPAIKWTECVDLEDGQEVIRQSPTITAAWLREHKLVVLDQFLPGWAMVVLFNMEDGYLGTVKFGAIPAVAPTPAAFKAEQERRAGLGLPPLEDWRCPSLWRGFIRRYKEGAKVTEESIAGIVGDASVLHTYMVALDSEEAVADDAPAEPPKEE